MLENVVSALASKSVQLLPFPFSPMHRDGVSRSQIGDGNICGLERPGLW